MILLLLILTGGVLCTACNSSGTEITRQPLPRPQQPAADAPGPALPEPGELAELLPQPRAASYVEADLYKQADAYDMTLPSNRVMPIPGGPVEFSPAWSANNDGPDLLAYCMYSFAIPDYDRNDQVRYWFGTPPAAGEGWIGLGNWGPDVWDWYALDSSGVLDLASIDPYIAFGGGLLLCVLVTGVDEPVLNDLRIGTLPPVADFDHTPRLSFAPQVVQLDASSSTDDDGTIVRYEWDFNDDGVYENDSGASAETNHELTTSGVHNIGLRVTDNDNATAETSLPVNVTEAQRHTWGLPGWENCLGCTVDTDGNLYIVGYTDAGSMTVCLLVKFDCFGQFVWAKKIDGTFEDGLSSAAFGIDGHIYACGTTMSDGSGNRDGLVQKWTTDGDLVWSKTWGGAQRDDFLSIAISSGNLYIAGDTESFTAGQRDAAFVCVSPDGELLWDKRFGGAGDDEAHSITYSRVQLGDPVLLATGVYYLDAVNGQDVMYLRIAEDGSFYTKEAFGAPGDQVGEAICAPPPLGGTAMIAGRHNYGGGWDLLVMAAGGSWARTRHWGESCVGKAVIRFGDEYLVGAHAYNTSNTVNEMVLMEVNSDGAPLGMTTWDLAVSNDYIGGLTGFADGVAVTGVAHAANADWTPQLYSLSDLGGGWYELMFMNPVEIEGTALVDASNLTVTDITTGVMDIGAGNTDLYFEFAEL